MHGFKPLTVRPCVETPEDAFRTGLLAAFCAPGRERPDLSMRDLAILLTIGTGPASRTLKAVSDTLGLPIDVIRRGVTLLVRCGYAARRIHTEGRRVVRVSATAEGRELLRELASGLRAAA